MNAEVVHMAFGGACTSLLAPGLVSLGRRIHPALNPDRFALPAAAILPLFVLGHAAVMILMASCEPPPLLDVSLHGCLLAMAIGFWLPVLGERHRLSDPGRTVYLFLAAPTLDLPGVWVIIHRHAAGGLAMIVAMLPIGLSAVVVTWRWILREDRCPSS
jgi:hypothetical protein